MNVSLVKRYIKVLKALEDSDELSEEKIEKLEQEQEELYYDLTEDEIAFLQEKGYDV